MALKSGFYNAMNVGGVYDRKYNADDYKNIFAAFLKDGVRRSGNNDLKVSAKGLKLTANLGYAICGGRWVHLDADYEIGTITPPVGDYSRIDAVVLRVDNNEQTRAASLIIRQGTAASNPLIPAKDTTTNVTELIIATVLVAPSATSVIVTDTRADDSLCGWVTTPVGYDDYFVSLDGKFEEWFAEVQDRLASVTLFKQYKWREVITEATNVVQFNIPQYDPTGVDIIHVFVNGLMETEGADYTLSGSTITFDGTKIAGTEIVVLCYKSIDGAGLGSVSDEITNMQNQIDGLVKDTENNYICNGIDDNVKISEIIAAFNAGTGRFADVPVESQLKINVYGDFGASNAFSGTGNSSDPYIWFKLGVDDSKRVIIDFSNCNKVYLTLKGATTNNIFDGNNITIEGLNIVGACYENGCVINMFTGTKGIYAHSCKFKIVTTSTATLAYSGTFNDCEAYISSADNSAYCFYAKSANNPIVVNGGKYRAYTASTDSAYYSTIVMIPSWETNAVVYVNAINAPTVAVSAFYQKTCFNVAAGTLYANGVCSALSNTNAGGTYNVYGLVALSRP